ncbi:hypothetical protein QBC43DRAFT_354195 [Cladorrhinum sp. PSN259]|nr:hypothetical protein QBC43DRAFT_354195 [Cladorrhinum sp. PSN259]
MRLTTVTLSVCFALVASAQDAKQDPCPTTELACHDIMNSSQCIANVVDNKAANPKEALIQCVEHEGTASTLPGAAKFCRCPGCHTAPINAVISKLFPPPCA